MGRDWLTTVAKLERIGMGDFAEKADHLSLKFKTSLPAVSGIR